ncbi:hypothetical protein DCC79_06070 [bacterium]|nr:hypothetical protein [Chloroflexi bacterium CFX6]RIL11047.1 MAG: hypothetical protein DCC79_06070 [bacterium]
MFRRIAAGCAGIAAMIFLCTAVTLASVYVSSSRLLSSLPEAPIRVDGDCPREAVLAYVKDGRVARMNRILAPLEAFSSGSAGDRLDRLHAIDIAAVRAGRNAVLAEDVPACLEELRAAEVDMADLVIDVMAHVQSTTRGGNGVRGFYGTVTGITAMIRGIRPRLDRMRDGWDALGKRLGIDFEALEEGSGASGVGGPELGP